MALTNIIVELVDEDGNAFAILGKVSNALKNNGHENLVGDFRKEAMAGDYNHLLSTALKYVEVE